MIQPDGNARKRVSALDIDPHHLRTRHVSPDDREADAWFYEEKNGLLVVAELRDEHGNWLGTSQHLIPWRAIRGYARKAAKHGR